MVSNKPYTLKRNFSWVLVGNVIYAICQWGILIVLAQLGNVEIVGLFTLGLALTAPIIALTNLQLRAIQATETYSNNFDFNVYFTLRVLTNILSLFIFGIIAFSSNYNNHEILIIFLILISKVLESFSDVGHGLLQSKETMDFIAKSKILKGIFSIVSMWLGLSLTDSLFWSLILMITSWFMVLIFYDYKVIKNHTKLKLTNDLGELYKLLKLAIPLGVVTMIGSLNTNIPRILLEQFSSIETLGYFASIAYFIVAGNTVINALGQTVSPRLSKYFADYDLKSFNHLIKKLLLLSLVLGMFVVSVSIIFGEFILNLVYGNEYSKYADILVLIMFAASISFFSSFLGYAITATRYFKIQPIISLIILVITLIAAYMLIPIWGIYGASYVMIITSVAQLVIHIITLKLIFKKKVKEKT